MMLILRSFFAERSLWLQEYLLDFSCNVLCFRYINLAVVLLLICYTTLTDSNFNWTLIDHVSQHEVIEPYVTVDKACHKKHTRC